MSQVDDARNPTRGAFQRVLVLTAIVAMAAVLLAPLALMYSGGRGLGELAAAAGICLLAGWASELIGAALARHGGPLAGLMIGMAVRMVPPLLVCTFIALAGARRQEYLAFIGYLLTLYMVMLAVETWSAVRRVERASPTNQGG